MKSRLIFVGLIATAVVFAAVAANIVSDRSAETIRYRNGSILKFDINSTIADEDGSWSLANSDFSRLKTYSGYASKFPMATNAINATNLVGQTFSNAAGMWKFYGGGGVVFTNTTATLGVVATNGTWTFYSNAVATVTINPTTGGITASNFTGDASGLTGITAESTNAATADYATEAGHSTNSDLATLATTAVTSTNWDQAATKAASTNATIYSSITLNGQTGWGVQFAARANATQTNDVFQIQDENSAMVLGVNETGHLSWANAPTNATGGSNTVLWLVITNLGQPFAIPLHNLTD